MVMDAGGDYQPSSVMTFQYYVAADAAFVADLQQNSQHLMVRIYNEHYRVFREREPDDVNYIAVVGVLPRVIDNYADQPWLRGNSPAWEDSNLIGLHSEGYNKLSPPFFEGLLNSGL